MTDFKIRAATQSDLREISRIEDDSFPTPYPLFLIERLLHDNPDTFVVATDGAGSIVGYSIISMNGMSAHLISIAVVQNNRRKGIATELLKDQLAYLERHEVRELRLEVKANNKEAIALYLKLGFAKTEVIPHYYSNGSEALRMRLNLPRTMQEPIERGPQ